MLNSPYNNADRFTYWFLVTIYFCILFQKCHQVKKGRQSTKDRKMKTPSAISANSSLVPYRPSRWILSGCPSALLRIPLPVNNMQFGLSIVHRRQHMTTLWRHHYHQCCSRKDPQAASPWDHWVVPQPGRWVVKTCVMCMCPRDMDVN